MRGGPSEGRDGSRSVGVWWFLDYYVYKTQTITVISRKRRLIITTVPCEGTITPVPGGSVLSDQPFPTLTRPSVRPRSVRPWFLRRPFWFPSDRPLPRMRPGTGDGVYDVVGLSYRTHPPTLGRSPVHSPPVPFSRPIATGEVRVVSVTVRGLVFVPC